MQQYTKCFHFQKIFYFPSNKKKSRIKDTLKVRNSNKKKSAAYATHTYTRHHRVLCLIQHTRIHPVLVYFKQHIDDRFVLAQLI